MTIDINELRKVIADCYWPTSPVTINKLLDRLEAAEKERNDFAQQLVQSEIGKRKISEERDAAELMSLALRAKVDAMERQEPVAWTTRRALESVGRGTLGFHACGGNLWGEKGAPLYAIPGAQPAPIAPEGWKLVPIEPTKEMRAAWDSSPICEDDDAEFRRAYSEMLAAAPEVKP